MTSSTAAPLSSRVHSILSPAVRLEMWENGRGRTLCFPGCWLHLDEEGKYGYTSFPDGRVLTSLIVPEKDIHTARAYGFGEDVERLWREHDALHHWVALAFGHGASPTIWSECHEDSPLALPRWHRLDEERFVGHVHRWLNQNVWHDDLHAFSDQGHDLNALRADATSILASLAD
jgi:hypothetical protein